VGTYTNLNSANINYPNPLSAGKTNKVSVQTSPAVTGAAIYLNITNQCSLNEDSYCVVRSSAVKYLTKSETILLTEKGGGLYETEFTLENNGVGAVYLTFFVLKNCLVGNVYYGQSCSGTIQKTICSETINFNWYSSTVLDLRGDDISIRWRGKWTFPETRWYNLEFYVDDTVKYYIDGVFRKQFWVNGEENDSIYMTAGEHDIMIEWFEDTRDARIIVYWIHPAGSSYQTVSSAYFRSINSIRFIGATRVACFLGTYHNIGMNTCENCPRGTCQSEYDKKNLLPMLIKFTLTLFNVD
jgi:hypothetical protein